MFGVHCHGRTREDLHLIGYGQFFQSEFWGCSHAFLFLVLQGKSVSSQQTTFKPIYGEEVLMVGLAFYRIHRIGKMRPMPVVLFGLVCRASFSLPVGCP